MLSDGQVNEIIDLEKKEAELMQSLDAQWESSGTMDLTLVNNLVDIQQKLEKHYSQISDRRWSGYVYSR